MIGLAPNTANEYLRHSDSNSDLYCQQLVKLNTEFKEEHPELAYLRGIMFHLTVVLFTNAPANVILFRLKLRISLLTQQTDSVSLSKYFLLIVLVSMYIYIVF